MNLIGSRSTLIANVFALVAAFVLVAEDAYIELVTHERPSVGNYLTHDAWGYVVPALVMFIIRNRIYSWFFLLLYIALSFDMFIQARSIFLGTYKNPPPWALGYLPFFFMLSVGCLTIYAAFALFDFVASQFNSRR